MGWFIGIEYVIRLKSSMDYYNDVLPICTQLRRMVEYKQDTNELIVYNWADFRSRFENIDSCKKYWANICQCECEHSEKKAKEIAFYHHVLHWSLMQKNLRADVTPLSKEEWEKVQEDWRVLTASNYDPIKENELRNIYLEQSIIQDPEYLEKVKCMERELTGIELTQEEMGEISLILSNPLIRENVLTHGIFLMKPYVG